MATDKFKVSLFFSVSHKITSSVTLLHCSLAEEISKSHFHKPIFPLDENVNYFKTITEKSNKLIPFAFG